MCREMHGQDDILKTKVLLEINEDFHNAEKINFALESVILSELVKCFTKSDNVIRELASRAVVQVSCTEKGRKILIEKKIVPEIRKLFDDDEVQIRKNAYVCLINLSQFTYGIDSVISFDIIPVLVDKLVQELEQDILILILQLIRVLAEGENAPVIELSTAIL
jgi:hypothetical protein